MKQFFKFIFASCLGTILAMFAVFAIMGGVASSMGKSADKVKIKANSILKLSLSDAIPEKTGNTAQTAFDLESFSQEQALGLTDILETLKNAKENDNIKGIYMELSNPSAGMATMSTVRAALEDFKSDGKFIVAYGNSYTQGEYYMASVADKIYLNPAGGLQMSGFAAQIPFFKDMLDRWGIKAQVFYAGKFKSATEPFRRKNMSEENRLQVREYMGENYDMFLADMAKSRGKSASELKKISDELLIRRAEDAVSYGLVDQLAYKDEVLTDLRDRLGLEKDDKIEGLSLKKFHKGMKKKTNFKIKDKIAVVYAEGNIVDGQGESGSIGGDRYGKMIRKIREDDKIKAIVLRVNSGGGSGLASEVIWRELVKAKEDGKNVVVSMGDVAASGGYYIACEGDKVFAEPNTITGSIGVFGLLPSLDKFMEREVGITFDTVKTGKYAVLGSPFYEINSQEGAIIQQSVDDFYDYFLKRVADGREMTKEQVNEIAQGRVWTGKKAKELGLVDELGGLNDAITAAAELAELEDYRIKEYPQTKDPVQQFIDKLSGKETTKAALKAEMGEELYQYYEYAKEIKNMKGVQARLPYRIHIK